MVKQLDAFPDETLRTRAIRKDAGKPRPKKYPGKWGHGSIYTFTDGRTTVRTCGRRWYKRLSLAIDVLFGRTIVIDGPAVVIAAQGARPKPCTPVVESIQNDGSEYADAILALDSAY